MFQDAWDAAATAVSALDSATVKTPATISARPGPIRKRLTPVNGSTSTVVEMVSVSMAGEGFAGASSSSLLPPEATDGDVVDPKARVVVVSSATAAIAGAVVDVVVGVEATVVAPTERLVVVD